MAIPISDESDVALTWYIVVQHVEYILYMNELPVLLFYVFSFKNGYYHNGFFFYLLTNLNFRFYADRCKIFLLECCKIS